MSSQNFTALPRRKRPVHGFFTFPQQPTIVFLTVCTKNRERWLATPEIHARLCSLWREAQKWMVGRYVLMPDHLHLFCSPGDQPGPLDNWVRFWKSGFSKRDRDPAHRWQAQHWDTRLRRNESYDAKWDYVRHNPVRAGIVDRPEDWPYQGELHAIRW
jgi:REP element-mobilizing transposase RayT